MGMTYQRVRVDTGSADEDGLLVLRDNKLVAVLVQVSTEIGDPELRNQWFLEAGFGPCLGRRQGHGVFGSLAAAAAWIQQAVSEADARQRAWVQRQAELRARRRPRSVGGRVMSSSPLDSKTILLVEDEPLVRMFMVDLLQEEGYRVLEAAHADEALTLLGARPDVLAVVTDVNMPGMTGFELARAIHEKNPMMSVVIMSAVTGPGEEGLPSNAVFLAKPTMPAMIVDTVNRAVIGTLNARTSLFGSEAASPENCDASEGATIDPFDPLSGKSRHR
ncbi:response regulator [Microvirga yunnanensis]|uniref:response regulator n=1 Tax=Microvirga yunnanensis TaxID=2953740 RepID=UPI0021C80EFA|nr:response regulator [Microvirga sp. HBU65207]